MAYEIPGFSYTLPSAADYRTGAGQFRFVTVNGSGKAATAGAGVAVVGVRQNTPNLNEAMTIVQSGISFVETGAAVTVGALVESDASGRAITRTTGIPLGYALETSSGAGVQVAVLLVPRAL